MKKKIGRPCTYDYELCVEVCCQVAEGQNIKKVLKSKEKYPSFQTWCNWKRENDELFDLYTRSIQDKAESEDEEIDNVIEDLKNGLIDPSAARLIIDTKKWKMSKYYPKMFGNKIDMTTGGEKIKDAPITVQIDGKNIELK